MDGPLLLKILAAIIMEMSPSSLRQAQDDSEST
jgi:hypothetical protein